MDLFGSNNRNVGRNSSASGGAATFTTPTLIILVVGAIVIIGVLLYFYFRKKSQEVTVLGPYELKGVSNTSQQSSQETLVDSSQLSTSMGNNFTFSMFLYMNDTNAERIPIAGPAGDFRFKPLVYILGVGTITADPIHQKARVTLQPLTDQAVTGVNSPVEIILDEFLVARWNQLTFSVEGRSVDVYLNGVLIKSALMENVPVLAPVGLLLETIPDFTGQAGLFQTWPRRLTGSEVLANYKRNVDLRGKPAIPDPVLSWQDIVKNFKVNLCKVGICGLDYKTGPLQYVDYEFA
jgi:hypothetical protein